MEEFTSEDTFIALTPIIKGIYIKLNNDLNYNILFLTYKGVFKCKCQPEKTFEVDGISFTQFKILSGFSHIQRRESYRLALKVEFKFTWENTETNIIEKYEATTQDISNGGMKFLSNKELEAGTQIGVELVLEDFSFIATGEILFREEMINNSFKYSYKVKFDKLDAKYNEVLSRYIFKKQVELHKAGRLE